jgi:hypothetical protein
MFGSRHHRQRASLASRLIFLFSITSRELISRLTRIVRRPVQYCHPPLAKSLPSRNSAVSTIGTTVEPSEIRYGGTVMLVLVRLRVWFRNRLSRAHFHPASGEAFRSQLWPIFQTHALSTTNGPFCDPRSSVSILIGKPIPRPDRFCAGTAPSDSRPRRRIAHGRLHRGAVPSSRRCHRCP